MANITISNANIDDIPLIMNIYSNAKEFMKRTGNPNQWNSAYPTEEIIRDDIKKSQLYVVKQGGAIVGVFAFIIGEDPTYKTIKGEWLSSSLYGTIHRIANNGEFKGLFDLVVGYCFNKINHLRIDTYKENAIMQHLIKKNGFKYCGIIHLLNGSERLAFEKL